MLTPDGVHVLDVSRIADLRQRLGHASASLKVIGLISGVASAFAVSLHVNGWLAAVTALTGVAMSFRTAKALRSGRPWAVRLAWAWLGVYGIWAGFASVKTFNAGPDFYSILGFVVMNAPIYLLARGLLALPSYQRHLIASGGSSGPLAMNPWEDGIHGSRKHPRFVNKWSFRAYLVLLAAPMVWLFVAVSAVNRPEPVVANAAELTGRRVADVMMSALVWLLMIYVYRRARRHALIPANHLLRIDKRDFVLYLRSFLDDGSIKLWAHANDGRIFPERFIRISFEELVTDHVWRFGPVVAIGDPRSKRKLVSLGAAKEFARDDTWQETATDLMHRAAMIVAVAGRAPGFLWELDTIVQRRLTAKLVVILPPVERVELNDRWSAMMQCDIGRHLPDVDLSNVRGVLVHEQRTVLIQGHRRNDWTYQAVVDTAAALIRRAPVAPAVANS